MDVARTPDTRDRRALLEKILEAEDELIWTSLRLLPPAIAGSKLT